MRMAARCFILPPSLYFYTIGGFNNSSGTVSLAMALGENHGHIHSYTHVRYGVLRLFHNSLLFSSRLSHSLPNIICIPFVHPLSRILMHLPWDFVQNVQP